MFALSNDKPIGMIVYVFDKGPKTKHIAEIFGFYVSDDYRGEGVGTRLLKDVMLRIRKNKRIIKVTLAVNPEQLAAVRLYGREGFVVTRRTEKELKVGKTFFGMMFMEKMF